MDVLCRRGGVTLVESQQNGEAYPDKVGHDPSQHFLVPLGQGGQLSVKGSVGTVSYLPFNTHTTVASFSLGSLFHVSIVCLFITYNSLC